MIATTWNTTILAENNIYYLNAVMYVFKLITLLENRAGLIWNDIPFKIDSADITWITLLYTNNDNVSPVIWYGWLQLLHTTSYRLLDLKMLILLTNLSELTKNYLYHLKSLLYYFTPIMTNMLVVIHHDWL